MAGKVYLVSSSNIVYERNIWEFIVFCVIIHASMWLLFCLSEDDQQEDIDYKRPNSSLTRLMFKESDHSRFFEFTSVYTLLVTFYLIYFYSADVPSSDTKLNNQRN